MESMCLGKLGISLVGTNKTTARACAITHYLKRRAVAQTKNAAACYDSFHEVRRKTNYWKRLTLLWLRKRMMTDYFANEADLNESSHSTNAEFFQTSHHP
jgi:hypothetical protein